jgi:RNA polymerase sigma-70 factor, ECF subfamily
MFVGIGMYGFGHPIAPASPIPFRGKKAGQTRTTPSRRTAPISMRSVTDQHADFAKLIVAIARNDDRDAFAQLFEHFAPRVKTLMLRLGASPVRAEELAQDALLTVWTKARLFDPRGSSASGWIYRIAKNLHIDSVRRDRRLSAIPREDLSPVDQPDSIYAAREDEALIRSALAQLSEDQKRILTLSFFDEKPHAEIAKELQLPLGTVKSRIRLGMQRLRALLDGER